MFTKSSLNQLYAFFNVSLFMLLSDFNFKINNTFIEELPADKVSMNSPRQVLQACFSYTTPTKTRRPFLIAVSESLTNELGLSEENIKSNDFTQVVTGNKVLKNTEPYAMCYGGHQFGHWAGQLGDGRAINLAQITHNNKNWTLQLKGAGLTPYSRTADGLAVLRSSIREYLCSEAMHHLGVPTTRALSIALSGDQVLRDVLYNGNPAYEKGAIVCRVAESFIRFGSFEIFASRKDTENLQKLTDYAIKHLYPQIKHEGKEAYITFFETVCQQTLKMIIDWQRIGFVHGVMNTDNMSILGLTIDYGPYGWLENYDPNWTPNTTDHREHRYRFGNQPQIALWNLVKLANALYPLIEEVEPFQIILDNYKKEYNKEYQHMMNKKIGLQKILDRDDLLIKTLEENLQLTETDMTIFYRNLANISKHSFYEEGNPMCFLTIVSDAFYKPEELQEPIIQQWNDWFETYIMRLESEEENDLERGVLMNKTNPKYVLRNYMAQLAIEEAEKEDYSLLLELETLLKKPYDEQEDHQKWFAKRPDWARTKVGCSALSCSS